MNIEVLLVQFLVLAFTGAVWWLARRDLASRLASPAPAAPGADTRELEQLCATLEALVTDLAHRLEAVERRVAEISDAPGTASAGLLSSGSRSTTGEVSAVALSSTPEGFSLSSSPALLGPGLSGSAAGPAPGPRAESEGASHAPLYALLDEGVTDPAEIARRTGLGRGEVDLILSLRARRAL